MTATLRLLLLLLLFFRWLLCHTTARRRWGLQGVGATLPIMPLLSTRVITKIPTLPSVFAEVHQGAVGSFAYALQGENDFFM